MPKFDFKKASKWHGVVRSVDFQRIFNLPRRVWDEQEDLEDLVERMTAAFKRPRGTMRFRPIQAAALRDLHDQRGLLGPIGVGKGKTLISLLAAPLVDASRPVLLLPASLREKTRHEIPELRKHWHIESITLLGYEELGLEKNADLLETLRPDLIIADEAHHLKSLKAGRTRRIKRWMDENPETMFVALSGTITSRSLRDYWHLATWALKETNVPMPTRWTELQTWADALDEGVESPTKPGALMLFCGELEKPVRDKETGLLRRHEKPREGYKRRLNETPGVIGSGDEELGVSLRIEPLHLVVPASVREALEKLRKDWETPNGDFITEAVEQWRHARELSCGFWYRWDPAPPVEWLNARRDWKRFVRSTLTHNRRGLDTELQVWNECERAEHPPLAWTRWREVMDTFEINTVPVWVSHYLVDAAAKWLREGPPGIAWTEFPCVGEAIAQRAGCAFYGAGEKASRQIIHEQGPMVASIRAHSEGKNLQRYARNLVVTCPPNGKTWEQMLGRTHREGQEADEVMVQVFQHTDELKAGWNRARSDARYIEQTTGNRQKLNYADITVK